MIRSLVGHVIALSLLASLIPTLVTAATVMMLFGRPVPLMTGYLLGAYTASITLGLGIVFALSDSSASSTTRRTIDPAIDVALGACWLVAVSSAERHGAACSPWGAPGPGGSSTSPRAIALPQRSQRRSAPKLPPQPVWMVRRGGPPGVG